MFSVGSKSERMAKLAAMGVGSYLVWYFAGPLAGEVGRHAFESYYYFLHGTPSFYSFEYWVNYMPLRGHATFYAYKYGDMFCAALSAPFFYKLPDVLRYCVGRKTPNKDVSIENEISNKQALNLSALLENEDPDMPPMSIRRTVSLDGRRHSFNPSPQSGIQGSVSANELSKRQKKSAKPHI
ncbi:hypothetical protein [Candidatus Berkiella aquae]|uniref:Uncharacterized protein n=1 Tax=Candidatus Berkiella aquae TaxID=295108 RepID=A0A0Q9YWK3_9GAMM|nr:hypothetical protein [Candidatus Berkiella aquae]MCS5710862.1 hypothetical protein [Candidatus Berkiella aquae]